jgi:hypothetical protein
MTYRGRVKNGQITLDEPAHLPEGAQVNVQVVENGQSVLARVAQLAIAGGLPRDYSQQHDHYVKQTPRK